IYSSFYFFKKRFLIDVKFILFNNFFVSFIKGAFVDIIVFLKHRATYVWFLITKHRLLYVLRIFFLLVVLYKPGLPELDYVYWFWSSFFYFFSNSVFFFSSFVLPGTF
ncbi:MAG: hypothetical protein Q8N17_16375, partial [Burkholderiaceae bacterium]|nr:hypothetical protein [Burkholderiaceae bacterium]